MPGLRHTPLFMPDMSEKKSPPHKEKAVIVRTPHSEGKSVKRKLLIPASPTEDDDKKVTPKRKRPQGLDASSPDPGNSSQRSSSSNVSRLSVPLSERQQMALLMRMTDESTQGDSSPKPSSPPPSVTSTKRTPAEKKVNKRNDRGETPLHIAAKRGDVKQTKKLIKAGAVVNVKDYAGWTPLHEACNQGNVEVAKQLLKAGANVNVQGFEDDTPLHDAAGNGHHKLVSILLKHGANPLQHNSKGKAPVDVAHDADIEKLLRREIISSNSETSSVDEVRSPTSPESIVSIKDEDRGIDVEEMKPRSSSLSIVKGSNTTTGVGSISTVRRMSAPPKSPVDKTSPSPRLFLKFRSAGSGSGEESGPNHGYSKTKDSKDPLFKSYILTMDTGDQQSHLDSYQSHRNRDHGNHSSGRSESRPSPSCSPVSSIHCDLLELQQDDGVTSHHHHYHYQQHHCPPPHQQKVDVWESIVGSGHRNNIVAISAPSATTSVSSGLPSLRVERVLPDSSEEESSRHSLHISGLQRIRTEQFTPRGLEDVSDDDNEEDSGRVFEVRRAPRLQLTDIGSSHSASHIGAGQGSTGMDSQHIPSIGVNHTSNTTTVNAHTPATGKHRASQQQTVAFISLGSQLDNLSTCASRTGTVTSTTGNGSGNIANSKDAQVPVASERTLQPVSSHGSNRKVNCVSGSGSGVYGSGNSGSSASNSAGINCPNGGNGVNIGSGSCANNVSQSDSTATSSTLSGSQMLRWEMRPRSERMSPKASHGGSIGNIFIEDVSSVKSEKSGSSYGSPLQMDIDENISTSPRSDHDTESRPSSPKVPPLKIILPSQKSTAAPHAPDHTKKLLNKPALPYVLNPTQHLAAGEWNSEGKETEESSHSSKPHLASLTEEGMLQMTSNSPPRPSSRASSMGGGSSDRDESHRDWNSALKPSEVLKEGSGGKEEEEKETKNDKSGEEGKGEEKRPTRTLRSHTAMKQQQEQKQQKQVTTRLDGRSEHHQQQHMQKDSQEKHFKSETRDVVDSKYDGESTDDAGIAHHVEEMPVHPRKRKLRAKTEAQSQQQQIEMREITLEKPPNPYELYLNLRRQIQARHKSLSTVTPKPPQGFKDYLMVNCTYVLQGNATSTLSVPMLPPPNSVTGPMRELFIEQEKARYRLRLQHHIEREKLMLSIEQEILREHARAARAIANQSQPLSVCTILREEEIYNLQELEQAEDREKNSRTRYNGRQFLSWLQDVGDKYAHLKNLLLLRHHHEAESLHAVQKMDWEWKLKECGQCDYKSTPVIDELHLPMVQVNDEFELLPS